MKKSSLAIIFALSTVGTTLFAQAEPNNRGGFQDPAQPNIEQKSDKRTKHRHHESQSKVPYGYHVKGGFIHSKEPTNVAEEAAWRDDQIIVLEGRIVKQVGKEDFIFKDDSGELTIEIERQAWHGVIVTPNDKISVIAEVEKSWGKTEVEALFVRKITAEDNQSQQAAAQQ